MYCTACGTRNSTDANFCKQCGRKVDRTPSHKISEEEFALPTTPDEKGHELLALAFEKSDQDDLEGAVAACAEAVALLPDSTDAHSLLSTLFEKQGLTDKAIEERERVLTLNPGSIADREKLDQLRDGDTPQPRKKINSSTKLSTTTLFDNPGNAVIGLITVVIIVIGCYVIWRGGKSETTRTEPANNQQTASVQPGQQFPTADPYANSQPPYNYQQPNQQYYPNNNYPQAYAPPYNPAPQQERQQDYPDAEAMRPRNVNPAPILSTTTPPIEREVTPADPKRIASGNTVHLDADPTVATTPAARTETPPRNVGRIEIVVSPGSNNSANGNNTAATAEPNGANSDSRQQVQYGQQAQLRGDYRTAARAYIKALDGSGDAGASIQQQIGMCYQRLNDKEGAISHYNDAIAAFKAQIGANRNVETANRGIKACEAGIRACQ